MIAHWALQPHDLPGSIGLYDAASRVGLAFGVILLAVGLIGTVRRLGEAPTADQHPVRLGLVLAVLFGLVIRLIVAGYDDRSDRITSIEASIVAWKGYEQREKIAQVARDYISARLGGDGAAACRLLTPGQQLELVARVTGSTLASVRAGDCKQIVTDVDPASNLTKPELEAFEGEDLGVEIRGRLAGFSAAKVYVVADPDVFIEAWHDGRRWLLDGWAAEELTFVYRCAQSGGEISLCGCIVERVRAGFPGPPDGLEAVLGEGGNPPDPNHRLIQAAAASCAAAAPSNTDA